MNNLKGNHITILLMFSVTIFAILLYAVMTDEAMSRIATLEHDISERNSEIAELIDRVTGLRDENMYLKMRPVMLEDEVIYFYEVQKKTGLDIELLLYIHRKTIEYDLDISLVLGLIEKESNFNTELVYYNEWNDTYDRGLCQLNSQWQEFYWELSGNDGDFKDEYVFDPYLNVDMALAHMRFQMDIFDNDWIKALGGYNRGADGLRMYKQRNGTYDTDYALDILERSLQYMRR